MQRKFVRISSDGKRVWAVADDGTAWVKERIGWAWEPVESLRETLQVIYPGILTLALVALFYVLVPEQRELLDGHDQGDLVLGPVLPELVDRKPRPDVTREVPDAAVTVTCAPRRRPRRGRPGRATRPRRRTRRGRLSTSTRSTRTRRSAATCWRHGGATRG